MGYMWMEGRKVYAFAKRAMVESCLRVLDPDGSAGREELRTMLDNIKAIIPHQANIRIMRSAVEDLESRFDLPKGVLENKMIVTIQKYGNTSTASIPIALDESLRKGRLRSGDLIILVGFGAGLTYGANLVRL
jgi:3-oxoacyl-[acyl-carrier-protein] synthase-3